MGKINKVEKLTDCKHLNLYAVDATSVHNTPVSYYVASRAEETEDLKLRTKKNTPVVLVRQYRYAIDDYIYEFPAGLVEKGEDFREAAKRELYEETGLTLHPVSVPEMYEKPYFTTVGMTDESCATVYGYADGEISKDCQEDSEEIEIVLADKEEVRRILREEKAAIMCAYMLMHFLNDEEPFVFLKDEKI